ncbi:hypothetical protein Bca52824_038311 [Brassica carinata]|uniref:Amino acid transporter transmembrane domain-containing protein n=1 Tax=Brassica carinata TaxID=52824 RepID=A0A8X7RPA6_BRACI|nr:hypothetical protein Bca52824_038311 [Brassica carinata]
MEDVPDISWGCDIDSVENATSLQRWLTNSGLPPHKMRWESRNEISTNKHLLKVSDVRLEEDDVLKLAFFENNAKDKRYNRHTCQVLGYPKQGRVNWLHCQHRLQKAFNGLPQSPKKTESFANMLSSVSFSVLSVSVQRIIKWDPLNCMTQISLALFLSTYTQRSSLQSQARSDLTRTRIHQSHKTRMKMILWWRQHVMIPFQSKEALIDEQIRSVQANRKDRKRGVPKALIFAAVLAVSFPKVYEEENMRRTYKEERNLEGMRLGKLLGIFPLMYLSGGACSILVITGGKTIKQLLHIMSEDDTEPLTTLQCFLIFSILAMVMSQFPNMNSLFGLSLVGSVMAVAYSTAVWTLLLASERNQNSVSYATKDTSHFDRPPKLLFLSNLVV